MKKVTTNGVKRILEVYEMLKDKDAAERSSYMRINTNKDENGEESVWLKLQSNPDFQSINDRKLIKLKLEDGGKSKDLIYLVMKEHYFEKEIILDSNN